MCSGRIPSGPHDLPLFSLAMAASISSTVIGVSTMKSSFCVEETLDHGLQAVMTDSLTLEAPTSSKWVAQAEITSL